MPADPHTNPRRRLTAAQRAGLERIRDRGCNAWAEGGRAGGAISRMFDRMAKDGLCTTAPHEITDAGKEALNDG